MGYKDKDDDRNYSEDYIRPVEEYRSECSDEHEHGQTYSNYNSEQSSYESFESLENEFHSMLFPGEQLLWCGRTEKNTTMAERGVNVAMIAFPFVWTAFAVFWTMLAFSGSAGMGLFGIPFIFIGLGLFRSMLGVKKFDYAITSSRVIMKAKKGTAFYNISEISNIQVTCSSRNIGSVNFQSTITSFAGANNSVSSTRRAYTGICGVHDPNGAARILSNAIYSLRNSGT